MEAFVSVALIIAVVSGSLITYMYLNWTAIRLHGRKIVKLLPGRKPATPPLDDLDAIVAKHVLNAQPYAAEQKKLGKLNGSAVKASVLHHTRMHLPSWKLAAKIRDLGEGDLVKGQKLLENWLDTRVEHHVEHLKQTRK